MAKFSTALHIDLGDETKLNVNYYEGGEDCGEYLCLISPPNEQIFFRNKSHAIRFLENALKAVKGEDNET